MIDLGAGLPALDLLMVEGPRDVFALGSCEGSYSWGKFPAVERCLKGTLHPFALTIVSLQTQSYF